MREMAALSHVYDAAINPGRWRRALDAVTDAVSARATALLIRRPDPKSRDLQMLNSTYLNFVRSPWGLYYGLRLSRLQNPDWDFLSTQPAHLPTLDTAIGKSAAELDQRSDYAFLRKRIGVGRRLGVRLNEDRVWFDAVSIAFEAGQDRIPESALEVTRVLLPHLTRAVEIGRTFAQLKARYRAALGALDHVRVGLAVAMASGEILVDNAEARRLFEAKDGLSRGEDGRLRCHDPDQTDALRSMIAEACDTARGEADVAINLMALKPRSERNALLLDVAPLRDSKAELDGPMEGALITIIDPDRVPKVRTDRFTALYDLTPAETDVFDHVLHGMSVNDIAESRNTSPVTAKNQVASILSKTGVKRRSELIRLVLRVMPPVD